MTEEEKNKRNEYERNRYHNMTKEQKTKKREYAKNWYHTMIKHASKVFLTLIYML